MNVLSQYVEYAFSGAALMLVLLGFAVAVIMPAADRWSKRFFITYFAVLVPYACLTPADLILSTRTDLQEALKAVYYFESLFASVLMIMLTVYLLHCCGKNWRHSALFRATALLWAAYFIMINLSSFTEWFYYLTPDNRFCRGPLYPLIIAPLLAIAVLDLACIFRWRDRMTQRYFYAFIVSFLPITIAMLIHFFVSVFTFLGFGIALCALSMFGIILFDQLDQRIHQERELAHQRASIMVLQMRPHFIYNAMTSIYYLCKQDPDLAQQVTLDFTTYLRKNFTAIASEKLIPFSEELEHTRAYLAVEQAQFEDSLSIEYDTPHVSFSIPPLTLQPIVENAVKHGMDPEIGKLHILIRTAAAGAGSEIVVEDTGSGYVPADDNEPHIALRNIQQRLEMMCGGKMDISPRDGGGTVVKVTIP